MKIDKRKIDALMNLRTFLLIEEHPEAMLPQLSSNLSLTIATRAPLLTSTSSSEKSLKNTV